MDRWKLKPLEAVGKIWFGMDRKEVRMLLGNKFTEFRKTKFSKNTTDDYGRFHVFYTSDDKVEAVEFFEDVEIDLDGKVIFPIKTKDIEKVLPGIKVDNNEFTSIEKSIGYATNQSMAESILVAVAGYYA